MNWETGDLFVIAGVGPSGSINLMQNQEGCFHDFSNEYGQIFQGDWVVPIKREWMPEAHAEFIKVLTRHGVAYMSEFVFNKKAKPHETLERQT